MRYLIKIALEAVMLLFLVAMGSVFVAMTLKAMDYILQGGCQP